MAEEPWNKHTPGDPMPCKCGESVVEVQFRRVSSTSTDPAKHWFWDKLKEYPNSEIVAWRFTERKGEDVIAAETIRLLDEIERLRAALSDARAALKPFSDATQWIEPEHDDDYSPSWAEFFTVGDFRKAATALSPTPT